jgi:hypothetical protein
VSPWWRGFETEYVQRLSMDSIWSLAVRLVGHLLSVGWPAWRTGYVHAVGQVVNVQDQGDEMRLLHSSPPSLQARMCCRSRGFRILALYFAYFEYWEPSLSASALV